MSRNAMKILIISSVVILLSYGCGGPPLERPEPAAAQPLTKATLTGSFLTESPDEIDFPVKVLFAIDCSGSMGDAVEGTASGSDPYYLRIEAAREFINTYNTNDNVSFEVMLWNTSVFSTTKLISGENGFTKDPTELNRVLDNASVSSMTDYLGTLQTIKEDLYRDVIRSSEDSLIRTKYIVIFLSDGLPNTPSSGPQNWSDIFNSVESMTEMMEDFNVGGFNFHTFLLLGLFDSFPDAQQEAENGLSGMSQRGNGQFRFFENAEAIDFISIIDMRLAVEYRVKYLVAYNYNVIPGTELIHVDSDMDGLSDSDEINKYSTDPYIKDTDGDGLSDFFEVKISSPGFELDPLKADSPCEVMPDRIYSDSDQDGLNDCEEFVKGTKRQIADTDADGIPDGIEFLSGTNPLQNQAASDSDFDGVFDWVEVQQHTNVLANDPKVREKNGYRYDIEDVGLVPLDQGTEMQTYVRKYNFTISNIDIMDTVGYGLQDGSQWIVGDNLIRFYIAEVPENNPNLPPIFRMIEVRVNISPGSQKEIFVTPADFTLIQ